MLGSTKTVIQILDNFRSTLYSHPLAHIIRAFVEFYKGNFKESLNIYKQILTENPMFPPSIRFAIGICYYRLGNMEKARVAFERLLEIEPQNAMAMIALSIIEYQDKYTWEESLSHLEEAFRIDENNPLVLKYLADHYFFSDQFEKSHRFCERGLQVLECYRRSETVQKENPNFRKEIEFLKSDFNYILGKIEHV